jgi:DNA-binding transcriptional LysR family regulator
MLLDRIALFVNVARHQSVAKTARAMHVSPSSVCQRLKSLENHFGVKLYKRRRDGIELMDAGQTLLTTASQVLNQLDTLRQTLNPNAEKAAQRLVVGATHNPSVRYLPSALATFQKTYPDIKVTFLSSSRRSVEKSVRDGEVDIAIIQSPSESCIADLFTEHFAVDTLVFFAHAAHPLTKKQKISFEDLADTPLIVRVGTGATHKILTLLRSHGLKLNIVLRCASPDAVKAAVRKKMGVGISYHNLIDEEIRKREIKVLTFAGLPRMIANSYIVYDKTKPLNGTATKFLALLREMKSRQRRPINLRQLTGTDLP